ncbi:MAG: hypothetical protein WD032_02720 [Nitrospirales bacterium]
MNTRGKKIGENIGFLKQAMALATIFLALGCATTPTVRQADLNAWAGVSVEALDTHGFFMTVPMFRTTTDNGTEIRNYAYGYDFQECFSKAGANTIGDFVKEDAFITCSSSSIVCNNIFYLKEGTVLEYAPTGRCDTDKKVQPHTSIVESES